MRHLKWIKALQLNKWAENAEAKGLLPEVIRRLVHATVPAPELIQIDFPSGEEIQRPSYDGMTKVKIPGGNAKVPEGITYWELSTEGKVKKKLDDDYDKRLLKRGADDFSEVTYIGVTVRDYKNKTEWIKRRQAEGQWREVRVYDSNDLEQWLEMAPAVALWLSRHVDGQKPEGMLDLATYWTNVQHRLKRRISSSVLFSGRNNIKVTFTEWLAGPAGILSVHGPTAQEVLDVFAAWVEALPATESEAVASRSVVVENKESWRQLIDSPYPLVLVASEQLDIDPESVAEAKRKGHHVLRSVTAVRAQGSEVTRLERMSRSELARALVADGFSEAEAQHLAAQSAGSFSVLKRRYSSVPLDKAPLWAHPTEAQELAPLLLAGAWREDRPSDQAALVRLSGQTYERIRATTNRIQTQSDSPIRWADGVWEFLSLNDAWTFLRPLLGPTQLDTFEAICVEVLGMDDPRLELPREERWMANIHDKQFAHSHELRGSLAHMLALLATREPQEQINERIALQARVDRVVRAVLPPNSSWSRWASLGDLLPLIAEAAPEEFLIAAEAGIRGDSPELAKLFDEEGEGFTGRAEHTGLLWALERLAWSPVYLPRAALVLAKLAACDPGGKWANRPQPSLRDIFLPWMPHTNASPAERLDVITLLLDRQPSVGWQLLLDLLPSRQTTIMEHSLPEWRYWGENWRREISELEYDTAVSRLVELAVAKANLQPTRWRDLLDCIVALRGENLETALHALEVLPRTALDREPADKLWDGLRDFVAQHRYFHDAENWELPPGILDRLAAVRDRWTPDDAVTRAAPLFSHGFTAEGESSLDWAEQQRLKREKQRRALDEIISTRGFAGISALLDASDDAWGLGRLIAEEYPHAFDTAILPEWLVNASPAKVVFANNYASIRAGLDRLWAEGYPRADWTLEQQAALLGHLPFDRQTWDYVAAQGDALESAYWERTPKNTTELSNADLTYGAHRLLQAERVSAALELVNMNERKGGALEGEALLAFLEHVIETPFGRERRQLDSHHLMRLLKKLQEDSTVDKMRLSALEWILLPALKHQAIPHALYNRLATEPAFFVEVLTIHYKAKNAPKASGPTNEEKQARAKRARQLLHEWSRIPGTRADGMVDATMLNQWIDEARALAAAEDRAMVGDYAIGSVLSHSPEDTDGTWPCQAVRDLIERLESEPLARGFKIAVFNGRGAKFRVRHDGGLDEREQAQKYQRLAGLVRMRWPYTGALLDAIARDYEATARVMDMESERDT